MKINHHIHVQTSPKHYNLEMVQKKPGIYQPVATDAEWFLVTYDDAPQSISHCLKTYFVSLDDNVFELFDPEIWVGDDVVFTHHTGYVQTNIVL